MKQKFPFWTLEDLRHFVEEPAEKLKLDLNRLVVGLDTAAEHYMWAIENYAKSATRGEVVRSLAEVLEHSDDRLPRAITILRKDATHALMGLFPSGFVRFVGLDGETHMSWVANDEAIFVATFKSRMAHQFILGQPTLIKAKLQQTGLDFFNFGQEDSAREYLSTVASHDPALVREVIVNTIRLLTNVFGLAETEDARNIKVLDGARASADWQLMSLVLDVVWPMENGELHSRKMKSVREIVNGVVRYVWGETRSRRGAKRRDDEEAAGNDEGNLLFDPMILSSVLTLRHQINTLIEALCELDRRIPRLRANHVDVVNRLDDIAYHPLRDWKRELERRLTFGDYRPKNPQVRRYTGDVVETPMMPRFKKTDDLISRTMTLIEAAVPLVKNGRNPVEDQAVLEKTFSI